MEYKNFVIGFIGVLVLVLLVWLFFRPTPPSPTPLEAEEGGGAGSLTTTPAGLAYRDMAVAVATALAKLLYEPPPPEELERAFQAPPLAGALSTGVQAQVRELVRSRQEMVGDQQGTGDEPALKVLGEPRVDVGDVGLEGGRGKVAVMVPLACAPRAGISCFFAWGEVELVVSPSPSGGGCLVDSFRSQLVVDQLSDPLAALRSDTGVGEGLAYSWFFWGPSRKEKIVEGLSRGVLSGGGVKLLRGRIEGIVSWDSIAYMPEVLVVEEKVDGGMKVMADGTRWWWDGSQFLSRRERVVFLVSPGRELLSVDFR